jgi:hypothetical protein
MSETFNDFFGLFGLLAFFPFLPFWPILSLFTKFDQILQKFKLGIFLQPLMALFGHFAFNFSVTVY